MHGRHNVVLITCMGAIWWGTRGTCPHHFFVFRFCIWRGFKNENDVCHVLYSCWMVDHT